MKFKVGDKVKHKEYGEGVVICIDSPDSIGVEFKKKDSSLHTCNGRGKNLHCWYCESDDLIKEVSQENILEEVLENFNKSLEEKNTEFNKVLETNLKAFTKEIKQRTIYDELVQDKVLEKAKELSLKDLEETIKKDISNYIKKEYGALPKKIIIESGLERKEITGIFHKKFEEILKIVEKGVPLMLTGPAGAGKTLLLNKLLTH